MRWRPDLTRFVLSIWEYDFVAITEETPFGSSVQRYGEEKNEESINFLTITFTAATIIGCSYFLYKTKTKGIILRLYCYD